MSRTCFLHIANVVRQILNLRIGRRKHARWDIDYRLPTTHYDHPSISGWSLYSISQLHPNQLLRRERLVRHCILRSRVGTVGQFKVHRYCGALAHKRHLYGGSASWRALPDHDHWYRDGRALAIRWAADDPRTLEPLASSPWHTPRRNRSEDLREPLTAAMQPAGRNGTSAGHRNG